MVIEINFSLNVKKSWRKARGINHEAIMNHSHFLVCLNTLSVSAEIPYSSHNIMGSIKFLQGHHFSSRVQPYPYLMGGPFCETLLFLEPKVLLV